jgi:hypothetical protein
MNCLLDLSFDQAQLNPGQVLYLSLRKDLLNSDFRMNERFFNYHLAAVSNQNMATLDSQGLFHDHTQRANPAQKKDLANVSSVDTGKINTAARATAKGADGGASSATSIVIKMKKETEPLNIMA